MPAPGPHDEVIRKLEESMPQSFWDSLIKRPPGGYEPITFADFAE